MRRQIIPQVVLTHTAIYGCLLLQIGNLQKPSRLKAK